MSLLQLILKQMRQRSLSTWLTLLSVMLGVGLAISIMIFQREGEKLFGQGDYGYDIIIGAKGSPLQLVLNSVYHLDKSPGNIPYSMYEQLARPGHPLVRKALPVAVGDEYEGFRVVATLPEVFPIDHEGKPLPENRVFEYRIDRRFEFAAGRPFHPLKFEAVIGSEVAEKTGLKLGSTFQPSHGGSKPGDAHSEKWTVVGILKPTRTASDRAIYTPLISFYTIGEHEEALREMDALERARQQAANPTPRPASPPATSEAEDHDDHADPAATKPAPGEELLAADEHAGEEAGHEHHDHAYHLNADGTIELHLEKEKWKVSAIFVRTRGERGSGFQNRALMWQVNNLPDAMAATPAEVMRQFYQTFLKGSARLLLFVSLLVTVVAAISILVSIYNSVSARKKEIAILRALGATRQRVLLLICLEAALVGLAGGLLGLLIGHALAGAGSFYLERLMGQGIRWVASDKFEWLYLLVVVLLAALAGLVPALKAYRTPVATHLVAG